MGTPRPTFAKATARQTERGGYAIYAGISRTLPFFQTTAIAFTIFGAKFGGNAPERALTTSALPDIFGRKAESRKDFELLAKEAERAPQRFDQGDLAAIREQAPSASR
jgi:microcystin-dependent protein